MNLTQFKLIEQGYRVWGDVFFKTEEGAPSQHILQFYPSGQIERSCYFYNRVCSRNEEEGPALEIFYQNGQLKERHYKTSGYYTRNPKDGPAYESFTSKGTCLCSEYWLHGKQIAYKIEK